MNTNMSNKTIFVVCFLSLVGGTFQVRFPTCSVRSIDPLNKRQIAQIESKRDIIEQIQRDPSLIYNRQYQQSIVTLTYRQQQQILRSFPELFISRMEYEQAQNATGRVTVPGDGMYGPRRGKRSLHTRVCVPETGTDPLILTLSGTNVVELFQMPDQDLNQWILEETCDIAASNPPPGYQCGLVERTVPALFVHLTTSEPIVDYAYVSVQGCVTLH